jgi:hypothetical protein
MTNQHYNHHSEESWYRIFRPNPAHFQAQSGARKQYEKCLNHLKCRPLSPLFPIHTRPVITNQEISLYRVKRGFPAAAKLLLILLLLFIRAKGAPTCLNVFTKHMIQKYIEDDNYRLLQESILLPTDQNFGRI